MRRDRRLEANILRRLESAEHSLRFRVFSIHEIGGFEEEEHPDWSDAEAYHLRLMIEQGLVRETFTKGDEPWLTAIDGEPFKESSVRLTSFGHERVEQLGFFASARNNIAKNVPTIMVSVVGALLSAWLLRVLGFA